MGINTKEVCDDCEKVIRNSSQHTEHWEAAVDEMKEKYRDWFEKTDDGTMPPLVADMIMLIQHFEKETR